MTFTRYVRGCTKTDKVSNETIRSNLNNFFVNDKINKNKTKWEYHVDRIVQNRLPKQLLSADRKDTFGYISREIS